MVNHGYSSVALLIVSLFILTGAVTDIQGCESGFYGEKCDKSCPPSCKTGTCTRSGLCDSCIPGLYGIRCNVFCPTTCIQTECYRYNVTCTQGCKPGWYGKKCLKQCSDCQGSCHRDTGRCTSDISPRVLPLQAAEGRGFPPRCGKDSTFERKCVAGCRGGNCSTPCPKNCLQCERHGNICTSCEAGKHGDGCNKTCPIACRRSCDMYGECARKVLTLQHNIGIQSQLDFINNSGRTIPSMTVIAAISGLALWLLKQL